MNRYSESMRRKKEDLPFEEVLGDDWNRDLDIAEVPIGNKPLLVLGVVIFGIACAIFGRVIFLNFSHTYYEARAEDNMAQFDEMPAPRGLIYDSSGTILADNKSAFAAVLDAGEFLKESQTDQQATLAAVQQALSIAPGDVALLIEQASANEFAAPIVLAENLSQKQLVNLQALNSPAVKIQGDFERTYPDGQIFSSAVGYTGRVSASDLKADPTLTHQDFIGKTGLEAYYDKSLRGTPAVTVIYKNAAGNVLRKEQRSTVGIGAPLTLTLDGGFQKYFYSRFAAGLRSLGRTTGVGIALDPQTGKILSYINMPGFDNNAFLDPTQRAEVQNLLTSSEKPLFDRAVNGFYTPGSTIKPLDGVAALAGGVIDSTREIFSPGYLFVPNSYNSSTPTKFMDWQYQGSVDLASALAQSSDVYFYIVAGGSPPRNAAPLLNDESDYGIQGIGISKLHDWWQTFGLGKPTGIDLPNESAGFLPTPDWKKSKTGVPWLLGDTYNVAIGQGSLLLTPLQLIDYIATIGNGGTLYRPYLNASSTPQVNADLTSYLPQIRQVQAGMRAAVATPRGTAYTMHDLPFDVCAKTGSAQVENNTQENALFVGYAPCDHPQIVLLILIEHSREGSLNAVPIAKDVMNWYYENRMAK
jgi:penicillin-binding protein 2